MGRASRVPPLWTDTVKPYYEQDGITIYHADCVEVLPELSELGALITDPPYSSGGQFRGDRTRSTVEKYVQSGTMAYRPEFAGDNRDQRSFLIWAGLWMGAARMASIVGASICCFTDWRQLPTVSDAIQVAGWTWRGIATWAKGYGRANSTGFSNACEFVVYGTNGPAAERDDYPPGYYERRSLRDAEKDHIAQKPDDVMRWVLRVAPADALICDPFAGCGATLRAAKDLGHRAVGIEVDERYCEMAARRLDQMVLAL